MREGVRIYLNSFLGRAPSRADRGDRAGSGGFADDWPAGQQWHFDSGRSNWRVCVPALRLSNCHPDEWWRNKLVELDSRVPADLRKDRLYAWKLHVHGNLFPGLGGI